jgi:hypothetical protein
VTDVVRGVALVDGRDVAAAGREVVGAGRDLVVGGFDVAVALVDDDAPLVVATSSFVWSLPWAIAMTTSRAPTAAASTTRLRRRCRDRTGSSVGTGTASLGKRLSVHRVPSHQRWPAAPFAGSGYHPGAGAPGPVKLSMSSWRQSIAPRHEVIDDVAGRWSTEVPTPVLDPESALFVVARSHRRPPNAGPVAQVSGTWCIESTSNRCTMSAKSVSTSGS